MEIQEQKPQKLKPKWLVPAIIVVGIIVLGAATWAGYNYWLKGNVPNEQPEQGQSTREEQKDETADWQTYRNEEYGFEIKYPKDWILSTQSNNIFAIDTTKEIISNPSRKPGDMSGVCKISAGAFENPKLLPLSDWLQRAEIETGASPPVSSVPMTIDGVTGIKEVIEEIGLTTTVYLPKGGRILSFELLCGDDVLSIGEKAFDQILSTFKFIK